MLTFSREQRCIEAAVAVASLPPSPLCISSLPPSLPHLLSCSPLCRLTGMKSWLLIKTPHPASLPAILPTCSLHPFSLFLSLFLFPPFFPLFPLFCFCGPPAVPAPSVSHSAHLSSPASSLFHFQPSSLHPSSSLPPPLSLSSPPYSSHRLSSPQLPRLSSRNRV